MDDIARELHRIYDRDAPRWDAASFDDFSAEELALYRALPAELRTVAEFLGGEDTLPHDRIGMLFGPYDIVEWNGDEGTFGQLRSFDDYPYPQVVMIGEDAYLDVAGEVGPKGAVLYAIGHELDGAKVVAESLLALLRQAGSYRA